MPNQPGEDNVNPDTALQDDRLRQNQFSIEQLFGFIGRAVTLNRRVYHPAEQQQYVHPRLINPPPGLNHPSLRNRLNLQNDRYRRTTANYNDQNVRFQENVNGIFNAFRNRIALEAGRIDASNRGPLGDNNRMHARGGGHRVQGMWDRYRQVWKFLAILLIATTIVNSFQAIGLLFKGSSSVELKSEQQFHNLETTTATNSWPELRKEDFERSERTRKALILDFWLEKNGWIEFSGALSELGINSLGQLAEYENEGRKRRLPFTTTDDDSLMFEVISEAQKALPNSEDAILSLENLIWMQLSDKNEEIRQMMEGKYHQDDEENDNFPESNQNVKRSKKSKIKYQVTGASWLSTFVVCIASIYVAYALYDFGITPADLVYGIPFEKSFTSVDWPRGRGGKAEDDEASDTKTFRVSFYSLSKNKPVDVTEVFPHLKIESKVKFQEKNHNGVLEERINDVNAFITQGNGDDAKNTVDVTFTARIAGTYSFVLKVQVRDDENRGRWVPCRGFPKYKTIFPCDVDPEKSSFVDLASNISLLKPRNLCSLKLAIRDKFSNIISDRRRLANIADQIRLRIALRGSTDPGIPVEKDEDIGASNIADFHAMASPVAGESVIYATIKFHDGILGWFRANLILEEEHKCHAKKEIPARVVLGGERFDLLLISLDHKVYESVREKLDNRYRDGLPSYQADYYGVTSGGPQNSNNSWSSSSSRNVYISINPTQLIVKEYFLKFIPRKLLTFRVLNKTQVFLLDDGKSSSLEIREKATGQTYRFAMKDAETFAVLYYGVLAGQLNGSETFTEKRDYFYQQVRNVNNHHWLTTKTVKFDIRRSSLLEQSVDYLKALHTSDWFAKFVISFVDEPGLDYNGVRREWFDEFVRKFFSPKYGIFVKVEEESDSVMPNYMAKSDKELKWFKLAGRVVGKCIFEGANGPTYRLGFPVRLARSFLAQLVGLNVTEAHLQNDAPDLYASKVKYIKENDVSDLDLTFVDEEYVAERNVLFLRGGLSPNQTLRVVELKENGTRTAVTNDNKAEYLDLFIRRRLVDRIRPQIDAFLAGLETFFPVDALEVFDESDLELLICGLKTYKLKDLRDNHVEIGGLSRTTRNWFWHLLSTLTPEQFAKFLSFTTGSSQIPPGGFGEIEPKIQIGGRYNRGLPTAQTCFNVIYLPTGHYHYQDFERAVLTAFNEGGLGFGLV